MAGGLWPVSPCWRQVLLLPDSQEHRLGRLPGHALSPMTASGSAGCKLTSPESSERHRDPGAQAELIAAWAKQPGNARLPARARRWPGQQGRRRRAVHPGDGIPSKRLVFVGRKFDPPGAVGWCLRPFLSGLKKEFSICRERLGLPPRSGIQSL